MNFKSLPEEYLRQSTKKLANKLQLNQSTLLRPPHAMGKIKKGGTWVPDKLTEKTKINA